MDLVLSHHRSSGMGAVAKISMPLTLSVQQRKFRWSGTVRAQSMCYCCGKVLGAVTPSHCTGFTVVALNSTPFDEGCPNARHDVVSLIVPVLDGTAPRSLSREADAAWYQNSCWISLFVFAQFF